MTQLVSHSMRPVSGAGTSTGRRGQRGYVTAALTLLDKVHFAG